MKKRFADLGAVGDRRRRPTASTRWSKTRSPNGARSIKDREHQARMKSAHSQKIIRRAGEGRARRRARPRPLAAGRGQHADAGARRFRRRGHQGRAAGRRHAARMADRRRSPPTGRSTRATRRASCLELRKPEARDLLLEAAADRSGLRRELPPRHARRNGARARRAARAQSEARHRAHLRLGPDRAV